MEVNLSPEIEKRLNELAEQSGTSPAELVEAALTGLFDELAESRAMIDRRYDEIKSGKVRLIPGDEVEAYFREKSAAARREPAG